MPLILLALALALRAIGAGWGLPELFHQDERILVNHALSIGVVGRQTGFYIIPPFTIELLFLVQAALYGAGRLTGAFASPQDLLERFLADPTAVYLSGRLVLGALAGTATVWVLWRSVREHVCAKAALWAALFLAVLPMHVIGSHYIYADIPVTLAMTLMLDRLLKIAERGRPRDYLWFGALTGWAAAIKYTALYTAPVLMVAHLLAHRRRSLEIGRLSWVPASALVCIGTFFLLAPYTLLNWPAFSAQLTAQTGAEGGVGWSHHLIYSLLGGSSPLFLGFAAIGGYFYFAQKRAGALTLMAFIGAYYGVNAVFSQPFARYMMPLVPALCFLAGTGAEGLLKRPRKSLAGAALIAAVAQLGLTSAYADRLFLSKDTRTECREWFESHARRGAAVLVDNRFFGPHLSQSPEQVRDKYGFLSDTPKDRARRRRLDAELRIAGSRTTFSTYLMALPEEMANPSPLFQRPMLAMNTADIERARIDYLVLNYADADAAKHAFARSLADRLTLVKTFTPYRDPARRYGGDPHATTGAPHLSADLFSRIKAGPYLEVYQVRGERPS